MKKITSDEIDCKASKDISRLRYITVFTDIKLLKVSADMTEAVIFICILEVKRDNLNAISAM